MSRTQGRVRSRHRRVLRKLGERDATGPLCPRNGYEGSYCLAIIDGIVRLFGLGLCSWRSLQTSGTVRFEGNKPGSTLRRTMRGTTCAVPRLTRATGQQLKRWLTEAYLSFLKGVGRHAS